MNKENTTPPPVRLRRERRLHDMMAGRVVGSLVAVHPNPYGHHHGGLVKVEASDGRGIVVAATPVPADFEAFDRLPLHSPVEAWAWGTCRVAVRVLEGGER